jgi:hypothetical protein
MLSLQLTPAGLVETAAFDTADGLYDCAWSEENENVVLAASGDGSVKVYDLAAPPMANPLRVYREHKHEVGRRADQIRLLLLLATIPIATEDQNEPLPSNCSCAAIAAYWLVGCPAAAACALIE